MITCLICTARVRPDRVHDRLCSDCLADKDAARATLARRRQMSERRLSTAHIALATLIGAVDERLGQRWDTYLMAQAETPRTPQTQARLDAMARAYRAGSLDAPMIELLYAETVVNAALAAVQADDVAIVAAERALEALSTVYELDGRWERRSRDGGHYLRRVSDGAETSPYTSLEAAVRAAERMDRTGKKMRVIIAGSRDITDYAIVADAVAASGWLNLIGVVVSGRQRGVDTLGEQWAALHNIPVDPHPADWDTHGNAAGPIRNAHMATVADALIAIPRGGPGTRDMIARACAKGLKVFVYDPAELALQAAKRGDVKEAA